MSTAGRLADPDEVRAILIASAKARESITYSEVLGFLGHGFSRPNMRQLCKVLGFIDDDGAQRGEPELAVLVVRQSDQLPGQGWWIARAEINGYRGLWEGPQAKRLVARLQREAFDYWGTRS